MRVPNISIEQVEARHQEFHQIGIFGVDQLMPLVLWTRNFYNLRDMELLRISYTKTERALLLWKMIVSHQAETKPNT